MTKRYIFTLALILCGIHIHAQQFYNLTAQEVSIDSLLPRCTYLLPLSGQYTDSLYEVSVLYPEYIDMSPADRARYDALTSTPLPATPKVDVHVVSDRKKGSLQVSFSPLVHNEGRDRILASFMLRVDAKARAPRALRVPKTETDGYAAHSVLSEGRWAKIRVDHTGVHQLTDEVVRQAGFSNPSKVRIYGYGGALQPEVLRADYLSEHDDLKEIETCTVAGRRLFFAQGPVQWDSPTTMRRTRNYCSDYGYYFITEAESEPLTVDSATFVNAHYPLPSDYHSLYEKDAFSWIYGGRNLFDATTLTAGRSQTITLNNTQNCSTGAVAVNISGTPSCTAEIKLNGNTLGNINVTLLSNYVANQASRTFQVDNLQNTNEVTITAMSGTIHLDFVDIYTTEPVAAPKLSQPWPAAEYVHNITNQDLHSHGAADMVIIIPTSQKLLTQAQRLADYHRQKDGLRVTIVPADELFNEFSSGTPDVNAYRRYLKMLYDRAADEKDMPRYLLLFGDGMWDNRMVTNDSRLLSPDDFLLCFESENSFSKVTCYVDDGFYCLLDDGEGGSPVTDKLDMAVGRFPVRDVQQAKILVDKSIAYMENEDAGPWQNIIMFMGDDGDWNTHMRDVNAVANIIEEEKPGYLLKRVMWDVYQRETSATGNTYPEVTRLIKQQQAEGALIMDYGGHGSEISISHERVLTLNDFQQFSNKHMPLWITASCDVSPFDGPTTNIGEECILNAKGGSMAFFGTTRTVWTNYNYVINRAFMRNVLAVNDDGRANTLGEAQRLTKNYLVTSREDRTENKLQYSLLGDPALRLNLPTRKVVVDEVNGIKPVEGQDIALHAGQVVTVKGHVESNGEKITDFTGDITTVVRDTKELRVGRMNDKTETPTPISFYDRINTLYNGTNSVYDGEFEFTFAVPLDINYAEGEGLMNLYAVDDNHEIEAHGAFSGFTLSGTSEHGTDGVGPSIYCYLNTPSFVDGGAVNTTPFFMARLTDKDGINAAGTGIGHDLQLTIDGEMQRSYNLNDNFTFDYGSYTSGQTYYSIPALSPGMHQLTFRAWDVLNNSSTAVLNFQVLQALEPTLYEVNCTVNPATTYTTFIISHDRMGSTLDVELEVFDMSGRLLWRHTESGESAEGNYIMDWDLTTDGGQRLQTGVYLYRVLISSDGSTQASKAKKLVIIGNN